MRMNVSNQEARKARMRMSSHWWVTKSSRVEAKNAIERRIVKIVVLCSTGGLNWEIFGLLLAALLACTTYSRTYRCDMGLRLAVCQYVYRFRFDCMCWATGLLALGCWGHNFFCRGLGWWKFILYKMLPSSCQGRLTPSQQRSLSSRAVQPELTENLSRK